MSSLTQPDWIKFLHKFGVEIHQISANKQKCVSAFLSVPFLDYAGVITATGILTGKYRSTKIATADPNDWLAHHGKAVSFPFELHDGGTELKRKVGTVEGVECSPRGSFLSVRYLDNFDTKSNGKEFTRFVKPRWLPAVHKLEDSPDLEAWKPGSRLASNIRALDAVLGEAGSAAIVGTSHRDCLIVDVKTRVMEELKDSVELRNLGIDGSSEALVLADMLRPDGWGPEAMRETFSSHVAPEPESGWDCAVICGSLNFIRCWDECDSAIRIAILCPSENAYEEAVGFANEIYYQRVEGISVPGELLALKPSTVDFQIIACDR